MEYFEIFRKINFVFKNTNIDGQRMFNQNILIARLGLKHARLKALMWPRHKSMEAGQNGSTRGPESGYGKNANLLLKPNDAVLFFYIYPFLIFFPNFSFIFSFSL